MHRILFSIVVVAVLGIAGSSRALDGGFDCAEGSDEDLATETQTTEPAAPSTTPIS